MEEIEVRRIGMLFTRDDARLPSKQEVASYEKGLSGEWIRHKRFQNSGSILSGILRCL